MPRAGLFGYGSIDHVELVAHTIFSQMGFPLEYTPIPYPNDPRGWFEEDVLEPLARVGVRGVDLIAPAYGYGALCTDWDDGARDAGCVDAVSFPDRGDRRPIGTNLTLAATRALLAHHHSDLPLDVPVLVRGAGITGSCIITALLESSVESISVYDPDQTAGRRLEASLRARGFGASAIRLVDTDDPALIPRQALVIDCEPARPGHERRIGPTDPSLHVETRPEPGPTGTPPELIGPAEFAAFRAAFSHQKWTRSTIPIPTILTAAAELAEKRRLPPPSP